MREIKFRAKDLKGNWIYGTYAYGCFYPDSHKTHRIFPSGEEIEEETLGQYTGLKDKNGKEIYEGDLLHPRYNRFKPVEVVIEDGQYNCCGYNLKKCEVIGNIYENPDLLK